MAEQKESKELKLEKKHNCCAYIGDVDEKYDEFRGIVDYLRRSKIVYAIAQPHTIYKDHEEEFWKNVALDFWEGTTMVHNMI